MIQVLLFCMLAARGLAAAFPGLEEYDLVPDLVRRDDLATTEDPFLARRQLLRQQLLARDIAGGFALIPRTLPKSPGAPSQQTDPATRSSPPRPIRPGRDTSPSPSSSGSPSRAGSPFRSAHSSGSGQFSRPDSPWGGPPSPENPRTESPRRSSPPSSFNSFSPGPNQQDDRSTASPLGSSRSSPSPPPRSIQTDQPMKSPPNSPPRSRSQAEERPQTPPANPAQPDARTHGHLHGPGTLYRNFSPQRVRLSADAHTITTDARETSLHTAGLGPPAKSTLHATGKNVHGFVEGTGTQRTGVMQTFSPDGVQTKIVGPNEPTTGLQAHAPPGQTAAIKVKTYGEGIAGVAASNSEDPF